MTDLAPLTLEDGITAALLRSAQGDAPGPRAREDILRSLLRRRAVAVKRPIRVRLDADVVVDVGVDEHPSQSAFTSTSRTTRCESIP